MNEGSAMYPSLRGRVVFITGGGSGIGASLTQAFAWQGAKVAFVDIALEESRALVDSIDPSIDSITPVWPSANFYEREVWDLFGVRFHGHPSLRRIMMPEEWQGHPLRKDYPVEGYR